LRKAPIGNIIIVASVLFAPAVQGQVQRTEPATGARIELRKPEAMAAMLFFGNRPVIQIKVNGKGPYRFIVDSGAAGTVIDQELADELKLPILGAAKLAGPGGGKGVSGKVVRVGELSFDEVRVSGLTAVSMELVSFLGEKDAPRGVLSGPMFRGYLLTFDYPRREVIIRKGELPAADRSEIFEYDAGHQLPTLRLSVAGEAIDVHLDTGSGGGIRLPARYAEKLQLMSKPVVVRASRTIDAKLKTTQARLKGDVRLGRYTLKNPDVWFIEKSPIGDIGYEVLKDYALTLDAKHRRIRLQEKAPGG
jgi:predicted aspartyl protease